MPLCGRRYHCQLHISWTVLSVAYINYKLQFKSLWPELEALKKRVQIVSFSNWHKIVIGRSLVANFINKAIMECAPDRPVFLPKKERWQGLPAQSASAAAADSADHGARRLATKIFLKWDASRHPVACMAKKGR